MSSTSCNNKQGGRQHQTISYCCESRRKSDMESTSLTFNTRSLFPFSETISHRRRLATTTTTTTTITIHQIQLNRTPPLRLQFARRLSNFPKEGSENWSGRNRGGAVIGDYYRNNDGDEDDNDDDDEEEEEDRSLDLLVKFVENVFKKISKRARKAVRSVLPITISTKLVGFSVNGVIILTFLWVLKAFLEVVCTLGSVVFTSILVIRGVWAGISYLQENRNNRGDEFDDPAWSGTQPAT